MDSPKRTPHPVVWFVLWLPFGATTGYVSVTLGYLLKDAGVGDAAIGAMAATNLLPHTWKFAWSPLVDVVWSLRGWYLAANFVSSLSILAMGLVPIDKANLGLLETVVFVNGVATTFIGMAAPALTARLTPIANRGPAAGWSQAGNVGGTLVGGLALVLAERVDYAWLPAASVAVALMVCSLALIGMAPPRDASRTSLGSATRQLGRDLKSLLWSRAGVIAIGLCFLPIGSGAAQNLFSAMAGEWHVSQETVALANGLVSGLAAIVGSLLGGRLSDAMERRRAYALSGVALAVVAFAMALGPRDVYAYVVGVSAYGFAQAMCFATFAGFVLEIIGTTGAATKYTVFAALSNVPIYFMGVLDGRIAEDYGRATMLWFDGLAGIAGAALLLGLVFVVRPRAGTSPPSEAS